MVIRIVPPTSKKERRARHENLTALRQQGMQVGGLAQAFWTLAVELEYNDSKLFKIFNDCLDYPLPSWEIEGLRTLDIWDFIDVLQYRSHIVAPGQLLPNYNMSATSEPVHNAGATQESSATTDATLESPAFMGASSESSAIMDATSVFPVVMSMAFEAIKGSRRAVSGQENFRLEMESTTVGRWRDQAEGTEDSDDELVGKFEKVLFSLNFPGAGESDRMTMTFVFDVIASGGERSSGWCMRAAVCLGRALAAAAAAGTAR
ncbi:hypothetical protein DPX16_22669 [Anabarilius grahami]|uniref:Uncharacterized protein n=1 Tax=Anabarilius grahami TaxID=495550 RepID=A0A3N0YF18_ANAGA|nr:hypothetical protein DPX16_22669 [Anabarilius grahami]